VLVCERREVAGGAAVSERPFGPDYLVTSLSYVVSLLPADLVSDLQLAWAGPRSAGTGRMRRRSQDPGP
jgi:phytoene dehydrogenase-like protein